MRKKFLSLDQKTQNIIIALGWGFSLLFLVLIGISPSASDKLNAFDYFCTFAFLFSLVFAILTTVWKAKSKSTKVFRVIDEPNEESFQKAKLASLDKAFGLDYQDEKVKVYFDDGTFEEYKTYHTKISNPNWCLVVDGGRTYHLRYGCFHKWADEYQKGFVAWKAMKISDAEKAGLRLCQFCEKADAPLDFDEDDDYKEDYFDSDDEKYNPNNED